MLVQVLVGQAMTGLLQGGMIPAGPLLWGRLMPKSVVELDHQCPEGQGIHSDPVVLLYVYGGHHLHTLLPGVGAKALAYGKLGSPPTTGRTLHGAHPSPANFDAVPLGQGGQ